MQGRMLPYGFLVWASMAYAGDPATVVLTSGARIEGEVLAQDATGITLRLDDGQLLVLAASQIVQVLEAHDPASGVAAEASAPATVLPLPEPSPASGSESVLPPADAAEPELRRTVGLGFNAAVGMAVTDYPRLAMDLAAFEVRGFLPSDRFSFDVQVDLLGSLIAALSGQLIFDLNTYAHVRVPTRGRLEVALAPGLKVGGGTSFGSPVFLGAFMARLGVDLPARERKYETGVYFRFGGGGISSFGVDPFIEASIEATFTWNRLAARW